MTERLRPNVERVLQICKDRIGETFRNFGDNTVKPSERIIQAVLNLEGLHEMLEQAEIDYRVEMDEVIETINTLRTENEKLIVENLDLFKFTPPDVSIAPRMIYPAPGSAADTNRTDDEIPF